MKILVEIDAPNYSTDHWGRAAQFECTNIGNFVRLFASRLEMGMRVGTLKQNEMTLHFKTETEPAAAPAEDAA
jgi:hypothetical protein